VTVRESAHASRKPSSGLAHVPVLGGDPGERRMGLGRVRIQLERAPVTVLGGVDPFEEAKDVRASDV
jgi:hypothetical protein